MIRLGADTDGAALVRFRLAPPLAPWHCTTTSRLKLQPREIDGGARRKIYARASSPRARTVTRLLACSDLSLPDFCTELASKSSP